MADINLEILNSAETFYNNAWGRLIGVMQLFLGILG